MGTPAHISRPIQTVYEAGCIPTSYQQALAELTHGEPVRARFAEDMKDTPLRFRQGPLSELLAHFPAQGRHSPQQRLKNALAVMFGLPSVKSLLHTFILHINSLDVKYLPSR